MDLNTHLRYDFLLVRRLGQPAHFVYIVRQRLLTVHWQLVRHCRHRNRPMHVIRRAYADGIQVVMLFLQHLAPVFIDFDAGIFGFQLAQPCRVYIGYARKLDTRMGAQHVQRHERHARPTEAAQTHGIARGGRQEIAHEEWRACCLS